MSEHYKGHPSGIECIDVVINLPFCKGNVIKYVWRCNDKGTREADLRKALEYCDFQEKYFGRSEYFLTEQEKYLILPEMHYVVEHEQNSDIEWVFMKMVDGTLGEVRQAIEEML